MMCKTDEKTRQYYFCTGQQNVQQKLRLIDFAKTHDELIIDFGGQERHQIQQYFILVL